MPKATIYNYILKKNSNNLSRVALNYYGSNLTYGQLFQKVDIIASALESLGVKARDVVTVAMINSPETICMIFALNKIGAVANMVYGVSTPQELGKYMSEAKSMIVVTLDMFQDKFLQIADKVGIEAVVVANLTQSMSMFNRLGARALKKLSPLPIPKDKRFISWKEFLQKSTGISSTVYDSNAPAVITYTGGTTGGSKGVVLSNFAVLAVAQQYIVGEKELYRDSKWIQVLPLFIAYGITCSLMIPMIVGMTLIVRIPMSDTIAELCKKFKPNHVMYGPAFWEAFAEDNKNLDLSNFIAPITGGDMLPAPLEKKSTIILKSVIARINL